jgi:hypothetical protein
MTLPIEDFKVTAIERTLDGKYIYLVAQHLSLDDAVARADALAPVFFGRHACQTLLAKEARWREDPPTKRQVDLLLALLEDDAPLLREPYHLTRGDVAAAITSLKHGGRKRLVSSLSKHRTATKRAKKAEAQIVPALPS